MKKLVLLIFSVLALVGSVTWISRASGTEGGDECTIVIDTPAQHYSWTGGPIAIDPPPAYPGGSWQANTQQEPHLNNPNVTWLGTVGEGLHYTSNGSSGLADWFYYQPEVSHEECEPPDTTVPPTTTETPTTAPPPTTEPPPPPPPCIPAEDPECPCPDIFPVPEGCEEPPPPPDCPEGQDIDGDGKCNEPPEPPPVNPPPLIPPANIERCLDANGNVIPCVVPPLVVTPPFTG
jgi:hypothetical protein